VTKNKLLRMVVAQLFAGQLAFQVDVPTRHVTITECIKALKDDSVSDWGQRAAVIGQEHCNGCVVLHCTPTSRELPSCDSDSVPVTMQSQ